MAAEIFAADDLDETSAAEHFEGLVMETA